MNYFSQLVSQSQAVELLQEAIARNRIAPAYLFAGPSGVGRSLAAKCFSQWLLSLDLSPEKNAMAQKRALAGNHPDLLWVEATYQHQGQLLTAKEAAAAGLKRKAAPQIRIEQIRDIAQFLNRPPIEASRLLVVIEEAQAMTEAAANALLKTLEEPGRATIILIAPNTDVLLPTIVSRCQKIPFYRLSPEQMEEVLRRNGHEAILTYPEILAIAQGSPGEAIAAFAQLQAIPEALRQQLSQLPDSPLSALELAKTIDRELDTQAQIWLIDYLQYIYWQNWRQQNLLELLEKARQYLLNYVQPRLVWECTLLEMIL
ncbi:DNA polymerase III subunit delta' [Hydrococcus rivularis NIES-593]|uniref:DNA polymerase III subunit delta n=1 Tax=Hydrococcus rivularis NIES-593 TaxID=1921803 RepID=A0A1U7HJV6_9CYAN|nr:DNA polymerase III subunit delta' [Hydrococcus rivularis]OKH23818.1 DNA polymerase III subunit delta' [Hydrococcus rivularis NIES-593]